MLIFYLSALTFHQALLFYDYCLTLGTEIEYFWKRARVSAVSTLFVLNRYLTLLGQIPIIVEYFVLLPPLVGKFVFMGGGRKPADTRY